MAITRAVASSITQGLPKSKSTLSGNLPILAGSYESIQTITVNATSVANINFTSIPSTYKHLQIRSIARKDSASGNMILATFNGDTGVSYGLGGRLLYGDGSSAATGYFATNATKTFFSHSANTTHSSGVFAACVTDILDYASTSKAKTVRGISGVDSNGAGFSIIISGLWTNSSTAINQITLTPDGGGNFVQYSSFALYGIK